MWSNEPRSLPDWVEQGYQILSVEIADADSEELARDRAGKELIAHREFTDELSDAEYAIEQLLNSGWLYEVDGKLRVTDPELEHDDG
ncbi:hypothetical protein [Haloquadratum walsbyi]|jgi:hypothetical protein|uniref:Homolog to phage PhiH1 repressor protein n=1 Tax=Haloquadratum walsbyi (strain DSM 16790 / HBSQ001) TaxID=362976 RepID=Q18HY0_HALWD|nr:hypothetical protein [Haloquadratum walsbyi]CAJ52401.1 uncharacterized protein HQ_2277A [Haloquadratum walsbyi DSM 16790]